MQGCVCGHEEPGSQEARSHEPWPPSTQTFGGSSLGCGLWAVDPRSVGGGGRKWAGGTTDEADADAEEVEAERVQGEQVQKEQKGRKAEENP
ncbi:hypothetical protein G7Z17_g8184 [Cylindrodendrum hubeiense]|uniref:Uncharacterized protein n=1 Tax=Cylindrodendrum hubeiense TaxID=595255 RepID=A0A9P5H5Q5_9HYPO|nr:hypothetical protein G7Z17_g8184 [Cylindrodendrum hubeiense]